MIYLDNAATTRPNREATERALSCLNEDFYNPSALYREGFAQKRGIEEARESLLSHIAPDGGVSLIFTACGSEADNQALFSFARKGNLVITGGEHSAVHAAAGELKNRGTELRVAPLRPDGSADAEALLSLVDGNTSMVSVIHVNNETGAANDVNAIAEAVKAKNPRTVFHSDGVQAFGKIPYTLGECVDLYAVSAHKIGGIKGVGGLFARKKAYAALRPLIYGGGQESGRRSGTENVFGIRQFQFAAERKFSGLTADFRRLKGLRKRFWEALDRDIFTRISPEEGSPYILSVAARGLRGETLLHMLDDRGVIVGTGSACSSNAKRQYSRVILACGVPKELAEGIIRVSFSCDTAEKEALEGARALNECAKILRKRMNA